MNKFLSLMFIVLLFANRARAQDAMYAHYIDVGQGACVLLEFQCGAILIDAGVQDVTYEKKLMAYLKKFFARRADLNGTLDLVYVTHPHIDHNAALPIVAQTYRVSNYIDDGLREGSGRANQKWMQDNAPVSNIPYEHFSFEEITNNDNNKGITDAVIDPVNCPNANPRITLYSSRFDNQPDDWRKGDFENYNNHSLVMKVQYGKTSFLFTGDLEEKGIASIVEHYQGTKALDADILMVGHHGAANATTDGFLKAVTPSCAVISCGKWNSGKGQANNFTTYKYGHPRISTINMLTMFIEGNRNAAMHGKAAEGSANFRFMDVKKKIYSTSWDNNIVIKAKQDGTYIVTTDN